MHALVNIALRAARDAAESLAHRVERLDKVQIVDDKPKSFQTNLDVDADKSILYHLQKTYPEHNIFSRISGHHPGKEGEPLWLVDPVLGSRNLANGYPQFGVSIAVRIKDVISHAVVVCPMVQEEYVASRGAGAQMNSRRIRVSESVDMENGLFGLNELGLDQKKFIEFQQALLRAQASPRLSGCSTLDMVAVASGKLQGGWCCQAEECTRAAASLILQEAGGLIGTEEGNPRLESGSELLFANAKMFKQLVKLRMRCGS